MRTRILATDSWGNPWRGAGSAALTAERQRGDYPAGRRCSRSGCITILNGYNPGPECLQHAPEMPWERIAAEKRH